jgi:ABC-type molybdenum transport system ATPase subunit/photorepair protein PhrA
LESPRAFERDDRLRLAMAHAWLDDPSLLLLDDPLHGASTELADQFLATFDAWIEADPNHTAIVVGRSVAAFAERCTRSFVLRERWLAPIPPQSLP